MENNVHCDVFLRRRVAWIMMWMMTSTVTTYGEDASTSGSYSDGGMGTNVDDDVDGDVGWRCRLGRFKRRILVATPFGDVLMVWMKTWKMTWIKK